MEHTSFAPMDDKHLGQFEKATARAMRAEEICGDGPSGGTLGQPGKSGV